MFMWKGLIPYILKDKLESSSSAKFKLDILKYEKSEDNFIE